MENEIYHIYDRIFKRIFTLSNLAIINLINGLFGMNHSPDSEITYFNKEFVTRKLEKRFADLFLQINRITYHLEAQMTKAENIVIRVFEYSFFHAMENRESEAVLKFPEPIVIYLDVDTDVPKESKMLLDFGTQGSFEYTAQNFVYQEHEIRELNQKKMVILIPFQLLKIKKILKKEQTSENLQALQKLILHDIIGSINANVEVGNITEEDGAELKELTHELYQHISQHYEELGGQEMKQLLEGAMELPLDKYRIQIDELKEELEETRRKAETDKERVEEARRKAEADKERVEEARRKAEADKERAEAENKLLREKLAELMK